MRKLDERLCVACIHNDIAEVRKWLRRGADVHGKYAGKLAIFYANEPKILTLLLEKGADINGKNDDGETPLFGAARAGKPELVQLLLDHGAAVDVTDEEGETPLHQAARWATVEILEIFLDHGADINALTKDGKTLLHYAAMNGDNDMIEMLLDRGLDINATTESGWSAIHSAAEWSNAESIELLAERGLDLHVVLEDGRTLLHIAANRIKRSTIEYLLDQGLPVNALDAGGWSALHYAAYVAGHYDELAALRLLVGRGADLKAITKDGRTALHIAASSDKAGRTVAYLIDRKAPIDAADDEGFSAVHYAATGGHFDSLKCLLERGASVFSTTKDSRNALHLAAAEGKNNVIGLLLEQGLPVDSRDEDGWSALHFAARGRYGLRTVQFLLNSRADRRATTKDGRTALHVAAGSGKNDILELLLEKGLSVNAVDEDGWCALHYAATGDHPGTLQYLLELGASLNTVAKDGQTALHAAAGNGSNEAIEFLLDEDVPIDDRDEEGWSALHYASKGGHVETLQLLLERGADPTAVTKDGYTAVLVASDEGEDEALVYLLDQGLSIEAQDEDGWSALTFAAKHGRVEMMQLLLDRGAQVGISTKEGQTLLHLGASGGSEDVVKILIAQGIPINAQDETGHTALHWATSHGYTPVMKILVENGADMHAVTKDGESVLFLAIRSGKSDAFKCALDLGAEINVTAKTKDGPMMPLTFALKQEPTSFTTEVIFELCCRGAIAETAKNDIDAQLSNTDDTPSATTRLWRAGVKTCIAHWAEEYQNGSRDLTKIPFEIVVRGEASVKTYLGDVKRSSLAEMVQRCKICVVGPSEWGKTSLVQSLQLKKPVLTRLKDRTIGIDLATCNLGGKAENPPDVAQEVTFWDFAGQDVYHGAHSLFYSRRTLFVLVVNLEAYSKQLQSVTKKSDHESEAAMNRFVQTRLLRWVRTIFAHQPDAKFVIVGTKVDKLENVKLVNEVWNDLQDRFDHWKTVFAEGFDRPQSSRLTKISTSRDKRGGPVEDIKSRISRLASSDWLVSDIKSVDGLMTTRQKVHDIVKSSDLGFPMWKTYKQVLDAVRTKRAAAREATSVGERIEKSIVRFSYLRRQLLGEIDELDRDECEQILRTLNDLGDILWYEHEGAGVFQDHVILDPMLVIEVVREVIRHDFTNNNAGEWPRDGRISHKLLVSFPIWKDMDKELVHAFKSLLQHFQLAYPADADSMLPESDLIVPTYWKADPNVNERVLASRELVCEKFTDHRWCWEYEVPSELAETVFEKFAVQSHTSLLPRTINNFCVEASCEEFATSISLVPGDSTRDVIRVEVSGTTAELSWHSMRFYLMKLEKVLEGYKGDAVWRFIVSRASDGSRESRHALGNVVRAIEDAIVMGRDAESVRETMPWMPPDLQWYMQKSWNDIAAVQQLQLNQWLRANIEVLKKLAIAGDAPRQFPALWSLQYIPEKTKLILRMSSDLSGRCYHVPIEIDASSPIVAKYSSIFKEGVSLLSNVVSNALAIPVVDKVIEAAKSAMEGKIDQAERVHNLIDKLDLPSTQSFDSKSGQLSPAASTLLLRDLLKVYNDSMDALEISEVSNLQCAVTANGEYVWAHEHEIAAMKGQVTRCSSPPSTWDDIEPSVSSSIATAPASPTASTLSSSTSKKSGFNLCLVVDSVVGLSDWDWHKTYCKWQLYYGNKSATPIITSATSMNPDSSVAPSWRAVREFIESVESAEMLRDCRLAVQVKRRSRIGWTKLIGEGEVQLRGYIDEDASQNLHCEINVPIGSGTKHVVITLSA